MAGKEMAETKELDANKYVIAAFLFLVSYGILFPVGSANSAIGSAVSGIPVLGIFLPLPDFLKPPISPMYLLMPFAGFFLMFFLVDWVNSFFKSRAGFSPLLPIAFFALALVALYVALFWYVGNFSLLYGKPLTVEEANSLFTSRLKTSAYYLFVLAGILGWVSRAALDRIKL